MNQLFNCVFTIFPNIHIQEYFFTNVIIVHFTIQSMFNVDRHQSILFMQCPCITIVFAYFIQFICACNCIFSVYIYFMLKHFVMSRLLLQYAQVCFIRFYLFNHSIILMLFLFSIFVKYKSTSIFMSSISLYVLFNH